MDDRDFTLAKLDHLPAADKLRYSRKSSIPQELPQPRKREKKATQKESGPDKEEGRPHGDPSSEADSGKIVDITI